MSDKIEEKRVAEWTTLRNTFKSQLRAPRQWTEADYMFVAQRLIDHALSNPSAWQITGTTTLEATARLVLKAADWEPRFTTDDWLAVFTIMDKILPRDFVSFGSGGGAITNGIIAFGMQLGTGYHR